MNIRQVYRILVFAFVTFLPIFLTLWCVTILPQIIDVNWGFPDVKYQTKIAGFYFTSFFYGLIVGSFFWPYIIHLTHKRNIILIALVIQLIFNGLMGFWINIPWICFCRFVCGFMHNLNTVGKDFIFEFADDDHKQYAFSFKSCFGIFGSFVGPYIGYYIYQMSNLSFKISLLYICGIQGFAILLFIIVFYLDFDEDEAEKKMELKRKLTEQKEEENQLINEAQEDQVRTSEIEVKEKKIHGLWEVFKECMSDAEI